jgi:hypothetical protein
MAFVPVPRDMSRVKTKVVFSLTKRQLVCFGAAAAVGVPVFLLTHNIIGNSPAVIVMILIMLPAFFMAMYEKDGQTAEKILRNMLRSQWYFPRVRPYKTDNFYKTIEKEGRIFAGQEQKTGAAGKAAAKKHTVE